MLLEIPYTNIDASIVAKPRVACVKCKRFYEPGELLKCSLCPKHVCVGCAVKRYGKKFCTDRCMFYYGLDDEP